MHATVASSSAQRPRELFPTSRSDLQVTWHPDQDRFVVSLWRNGTCVGSAPLPPEDAARLAGHITLHLGDR